MGGVTDATILRIARQKLKPAASGDRNCGLWLGRIAEEGFEPTTFGL